MLFCQPFALSLFLWFVSIKAWQLHFGYTDATFFHDLSGEEPAQTLQNEEPEARQAVAGSAWIAPPLAQTAGASGTRWNVQRAELEQRLNNYLLNHMEYATMGDMQGMLPYSRLAGYDRVPTQ